jgi:lipooligosaccharide transport system ATP-binding protein
VTSPEGDLVSPQTAKEPVIQVRSLVKRYGPLVAVGGVDLDVQAGDCLGLLGPNGAGKSTIVRMLYGHTPPTSGTIHLFGLHLDRNPRKVKRWIGVVSQEDNLDPDFTVLQNLTVYGRYFGIRGREGRRRAEELLEFLQLQDKRDARIRELSGGMKRRLVIARALIHAPRLLILDEPTTGLDPQARQAIWQRVRALRRSGTTLLLTTHYMEEAARLCNRVVILDHGGILESGAPDALVMRHAPGQVVELTGHPPEAVAFAQDAGWRYEVAGDRLLVYGEDGLGESRLREVCETFPVEHAVLRSGSLEDVFLRLTGRELRD